MPTLVIALITILAGAIGNVLIKVGMQTMDAPSIAKVFTNPALLLGIIFLAGSFPFYSLMLQRMNISVAFPLVTSSTFLVVVLISYFALKEPLTLQNLLGIFVLIIGLWLVAQR